MERTSLFTIAATAAALFAGSALAQPAGDDAAKGPGAHHPGHRLGGMLVRTADVDQDGAVSQDEWQDFLALLDISGNGEIEPQILHQIVNHRRLTTRLSLLLDRDDDGLVTPVDLEELFAHFDQNDDGMLSEEDRPGDGPADDQTRHPHRGRGRGHGHHDGGFVRLADADQDQTVSAEEWRTFVDSLEIGSDGGFELGQFADRPQPPTAGHPGHGQRHPGGLLDSDQDGTLEIDDLQAIFSQLDSNSDGTLDAEELPHRRHHLGRQGRRGRSGQGGRGGFGQPANI